MPMIYDKFVFKTDISLEDYLGLSMLIVKSKMTFFVILADIFLCSCTFNLLGKSWVLSGALFIVLFAVLYFAYRAFIVWRAKRIFNSASRSSEITLTLDEKGIVQTAKGGETELLWENVYAVFSNKTCYYVFLKPRTAFYFPKRNFKDKEDEQLFTDYIINNVKLSKIHFK